MNAGRNILAYLSNDFITSYLMVETKIIKPSHTVHEYMLSHFSSVWLCDPDKYSSDKATLQALCPWDSPDKNTGVGFHAFLQGIVLTQGSNLCLLCHLHWQAGSLPIMPPTRKTLLQSMGSQRDRNHSATFTYSHWKTKQSDKKKKKRATTKNTITASSWLFRTNL